MTHIKSLAMLASLALLVGGACGKKDEGKKDEGKKEGGGTATATAAKQEGGLVGGCDRRANEKLCEEYYGSMAKPDWIKQQCAARETPYVDKCPTEGLVARCSTSPGTPQEMALYFYEGFSMETAKAFCDGLSGTLK